MRRNICSACENCVYNSQSVEFCVKHECGMVVNILKDLEYQRIKCNMSSQYGSTVRNELKQELNTKFGRYTTPECVKEVFHSGKTTADVSKSIYTDTDSIIVSKDNSLCMYDHAKEMLENPEIDK